jgi:GTP 3',8-cyclase
MIVLPFRSPPDPRFVNAELDGAPCSVQLPLVVEVEVNSRCNRRCGYCPVYHEPHPPVPKYMEKRLFLKLIDELATLGFNGRLSYHFYSEPLLRKDLEELVAAARCRLTEACQILYTNGDYLDDTRHASLLEAGVDWFVVTRHDGDGDAFPARERQTVLVPGDLHLTNRGGTLFNLRHTLQVPCHAPEEILVVAANGDVLLCYEDASRQNPMGNIETHSLLSIWTGPDFRHLRSSLQQGNRRAACGICRSCNNTAHRSQGSSWFAL